MEGKRGRWSLDHVRISKLLIVIVENVFEEHLRHTSKKVTANC